MKKTWKRLCTGFLVLATVVTALPTTPVHAESKVIRGGVKIQKRDLETGDTKPQGSATLKDTAFDIISLNNNSVLVEGKLYKKNEVVKTIRTDIEGMTFSWTHS